MSQESDNSRLEIHETLARLGGDRELLGELYAAFAEDAPGKFRDLEAAVTAGDMSQVMKRAHSLKGSAAAVGANQCRAIAVELEARAEGDERGAVQQLLDRLKDEMDQVLALIHQQL